MKPIEQNQNNIYDNENEKGEILGNFENYNNNDINEDENSFYNLLNQSYSDKCNKKSLNSTKEKINSNDKSIDSFEKNNDENSNKNGKKDDKSDGKFIILL